MKRTLSLASGHTRTINFVIHVFTTFFIGLTLAFDVLHAQTFCGRTLQEWLQRGVNVIDRRGTSPCGQTIQGTNQPDLILGTECADNIDGNRRGDCIYGFGGTDVLRGGPGDDEIWGGSGNDQIWGDAQSDRLYGEHGNDRLIGDQGSDKLFGGPGDDELIGGQGRNELSGGLGDDELIGDAGRDVLFGGPGDDELVGRAGRDQLCGQGGNDRLDGRSARDDLDGGPGQDVCDGGNQRDRCDLCESATSCERSGAPDCPADPSFLAGIANPDCTVCARSLADGALYCTKADDAGSFAITAGEVPPSTTSATLPNGSFQVFCIDCQGDGVLAASSSNAIDVTCTLCTGQEFVAGRCDFFQGCGAGDTVEGALPRPALYQYLFNNTLTTPPLRPPLDFDELPGVAGVPTDSHFAHTFTGLPANACAATLSATLQATTDATGGSADNDTLNLDLNQAGTGFAWGGGVAALTGTNWPQGAVGTINLDLRNLPGGTNLLANPSAFADGNLDVYLQDDTGVDCMRLCVHTRCADLTVTKELTGGSLNGNVKWEFTLTVSNVGAMATLGPVGVKDVLPAGLRFVSGGGSGWTCTAAGQQVTCTYDSDNFPPIPAGGTSQVTIVVEAANRSVFRSLENCATVELSEDTNPANDEGCTRLPCPDAGDPRVHPLDGDRDPAVCAAAGPDVCGPTQTWYWGTCGCGCLDPITADLSVRKSFIGDPGTDSGTVQVSVVNEGDAATAGDVTVVDPLPDGVGFLASGDFGEGWTCVEEQRRVVCRHPGPLGPGMTLPMLKIPVSREGELAAGTRNCAQVATAGDSNPGNDTSCATFEVCPDPGDPRVRYTSRDPEQCAFLRIACPRGQSFFSGACGCGCLGSIINNFKWRFWGIFQEGVDAFSPAGAQGVATEVDFGDSWALGTGFEYRWNERFGLELSAMALNTDVRTVLREGDAGEAFLTEEDTGTTSLVTFGANFHLTPQSRIDVYAGPFVGLLDLPDPPLFTSEEGLAVGLAVGFDLPLGDGPWGLSGTLRYLEAGWDLKNDETGSVTRATFDPLTVGIGICYAF